MTTMQYTIYTMPDPDDTERSYAVTTKLDGDTLVWDLKDAVGPMFFRADPLSTMGALRQQTVDEITFFAGLKIRGFNVKIFTDRIQGGTE